jgi:NitT/TauT family transport system substrate-binding protein
LRRSETSIPTSKRRWCITPFTTKRPDAAQQFMKAYIKGVRYYNDAVVDTQLTGAIAEIIGYHTRYSLTKNADLVRTLVPAAVHPDGDVNVAGLERDLAFAKTLGLVPTQAVVNRILNLSFAKAAAVEPWALCQGADLTGC